MKMEILLELVDEDNFMEIIDEFTCYMRSSNKVIR